MQGASSFVLEVKGEKRGVGDDLAPRLIAHQAEIPASWASACRRLWLDSASPAGERAVCRAGMMARLARTTPTKESTTTTVHLLYMRERINSKGTGLAL